MKDSGRKTREFKMIKKNIMVAIRDRSKGICGNHVGDSCMHYHRQAVNNILGMACMLHSMHQILIWLDSTWHIKQAVHSDARLRLLHQGDKSCLTVLLNSGVDCCDAFNKSKSYVVRNFIPLIKHWGS